jgi:hypothetical protein
MSLLIVIVVIVVAYFFFPVSAVELVKKMSAKRYDDWKSVFSKKED